MTAQKLLDIAYMVAMMVTLFVILSLFSGCIRPIPASKFVKAGVTEADFKRDSYECERDARVQASQLCCPSGKEFYTTCMEARGYTKQ